MYFKGVKVYNADRPWLYAQGGKIHQRPAMTLQQRLNDSVHIIAQPNELIVPVTHKKYPKQGQLVNKVIDYLDTLGVKLPNT
jgi:hypothetical protein